MMTAKRGWTLFEAMQEARGEPPARSETSKEQAPAEGEPPVPPAVGSLTPAQPKYELQLTLRQTLIALAVIVALIIVAMYIGYSIGRAATRPRTSAVGQPVPVNLSMSIVEATGSKPLETAAPRYDESLKPGDVSSALRATVPSSSGQDTAVELGGGLRYRVRILSTSQNYKAEVDRVRKFLAEKGIETAQEFRSGFYILYTQEAFRSKSDEAVIGLWQRLKELGKEYAQVSRTNTTFSDASIVEKPRVGGG